MKATYFRGMRSGLNEPLANAPHDSSFPRHSKTILAFISLQVTNQLKGQEKYTIYVRPRINPSTRNKQISSLNWCEESLGGIFAVFYFEILRTELTNHDNIPSMTSVTLPGGSPTGGG